MLCIGSNLGAEIWWGMPHYAGSDRFLPVNAMMKTSYSLAVSAAVFFTVHSRVAASYSQEPWLSSLCGSTKDLVIA